VLARISALSNLGSAGAADLAQATIAAQPRSLASPARLEFDGVDDAQRATISLASARSTYYMALLYRVAQAQTDLTDRGLAYCDANDGSSNHRIHIGQGGFAANTAGSRIVVIVVSNGATYNMEYAGGDLSVGELYLVEVLFVGSTVSGWVNGSPMTERRNDGLSTASMAAQVRAGWGVRTTQGSNLSFCAMGGMAFWLGTTDRSTEVRAYAAAQGVSF
jgi:hypothetical protein